jgi:hypothetical protein
MAFLELLVEGNKRRESGGDAGKKGKPSSQIIAIGSVGGLTRFTDSFILQCEQGGGAPFDEELGGAFRAV